MLSLNTRAWLILIPSLDENPCLLLRAATRLTAGEAREICRSDHELERESKSLVPVATSLAVRSGSSSGSPSASTYSS